MNARHRLLTLLVLLVVPACSHGPAAKAPATTPSAPAGNDEAERLGPLGAGLDGAAVTKILGEPEQKGEVQEQAADGMWVTQWDWPAKGVSLLLDSATRDGSFSIASMTIHAPCAFKTSKNVGVGSTRAEVEEAYGAAVNQEESRADSIVVGSAYGGVIFTLADGKVSEIFIGSAAE
jgi:hypothetical protein